MRKKLGSYMSSTDYLLHSDMFDDNRFPTCANIVNVGLGESNLLNIAGGLSKTGKTVYVYGVAGFIIHRYEQLKFSCCQFGSKYGKIIICNAGKYGYDKFGAGHSLDDDIKIMNILNIQTYQPVDLYDFEYVLDHINKQKTGIYYIQLGSDH